MRRFHGSFRMHSDKTFWVLFIAAGILLLVSTLAGLHMAEIAAGVMLIALGLHKLDLELRHIHMEDHTTTVSSDIRRIHDWMGESHSAIHTLKNQHENRIHKLDQKRGKSDARSDKNYRELVRKIIHLENKVNEISRTARDTASIKAARKDVRSIKKTAAKGAKPPRKKPYKGRK